MKQATEPNPNSTLGRGSSFSVTSSKIENQTITSVPTRLPSTDGGEDPDDDGEDPDSESHSNGGFAKYGESTQNLAARAPEELSGSDDEAVVTIGGGGDVESLTNSAQTHLQNGSHYLSLTLKLCSSKIIICLFCFDCFQAS